MNRLLACLGLLHTIPTIKLRANEFRGVLFSSNSSSSNDIEDLHVYEIFQFTLLNTNKDLIHYILQRFGFWCFFLNFLHSFLPD